MTDSPNNFNVVFHDSDFRVKSKFVNFSPRNKLELVGLLTKGKFPIISLTGFRQESSEIIVTDYEYVLSVDEVINEELLNEIPENLLQCRTLSSADLPSPTTSPNISPPDTGQFYYTQKKKKKNNLPSPV